MTKAAIKFNGIVSSISCKVDGSLGLRLSTPTLTSNEKVAILDLQGINTEVFLKPLDDEIDDIVVVDKDIEQKTSSQRFRNVLYLIWKQQGEIDGFPIYYKSEMEKIIDHYKNKLD